MSKATHLVWSTGGSMVPVEVMNSYYEQGKKFNE
jgi:D-serine dehydratase